MKPFVLNAEVFIVIMSSAKIMVFVYNYDKYIIRLKTKIKL